MNGIPVLRSNSSDVLKDNIVIFNLRGYRFEIEGKMITKLPQISPFCEGLKGKGKGQNETVNSMISQHFQKHNELYVNRNPVLFHYILDYLNNGKLHFPDSLCTEAVQNELEFWGIEEKCLAPCCYDRMLKEQDTTEIARKLTKLWKLMTFKKRYKAAKNESASSISVPKLREKLWNLLERPNSSKFAKAWMVCSIIIIILSISTLILETEQALREPKFNFTEMQQESNLSFGEGIYKYYILNSLPQPWIVFIDIFCTIVLSIEYILRFIVNVDKCKFLIKPLNIAELLGLLPMWVHFGILVFGKITNYNSNWMQSILDAFSFLKLCRTLRFGRIMMMNKQLRIVFLALAHSWQELGIMVSIILVSATIFGSIIYYIELDRDIFHTVSQGIWWSIITMTTVGYGDVYPKTKTGYIIGVICSLCGIVLIALATTVIVNHFLVTNSAVELYERSKKSSVAGKSNIDHQNDESDDDGDDDNENNTEDLSTTNHENSNCSDDDDVINRTKNKSVNRLNNNKLNYTNNIENNNQNEQTETKADTNNVEQINKHNKTRKDSISKSIKVAPMTSKNNSSKMKSLNSSVDTSVGNCNAKGNVKDCNGDEFAEVTFKNNTTDCKVYMISDTV